MVPNVISVTLVTKIVWGFATQLLKRANSMLVPDVYCSSLLTNTGKYNLETSYYMLKSGGRLADGSQWRKARKLNINDNPWEFERGFRDGKNHQSLLDNARVSLRIV